MRALVTGAAGFLGGHLVRALAADRYTVRALVKSPADRDDWKVPVERIVGDVRDAEAMRRATPDVDVVFHCAAALPGAPDQELWDTNLAGTRNLLSACLASSVERFVNVSTDSVYGDGDQRGATERTPLDPTYFSEGAYPRTKLEAEALVLACGRDHGLAVSSVRPCLMYGPGRAPGNDILRRWATRRAHLAWDGGRAEMSWLYVEDAVSVLMRAAVRPEAIGQVYNVSDGAGYARRDVLAALERLTGRRAPRVPLPSRPVRAALSVIHPVARRAGGPLGSMLDPARVRFTAANHVIDCGKAMRELGYRPAMPLWDGLVRTRRWLEDPDASPW
jgi:nucleoside-diphosphate-sugar epimerase